MIALFQPAIKLANSVSFKIKFMLVTVLFAIPLVVFFLSLSSIQRANVASADYKLKASSYIVPLRRLVEHVAQTRGMTNTFLLGDSSFESKVLDKRKQVNDDFSLLLSVDSQMGALFNVSGQPGAFQQRWQTITQQAFSSGAPAETFAQYTTLIADILNFMDTIGREGQMLQDSDAANSYMINSLLHTIPAQVESLGKLRGKGSGVIAAQALTVQNKVQVAALADNRNSVQLEKDLDYLFAVAPALERLLVADATAAKSKLSAYLALADKQIISAEKSSMAAADFFAAGTDTINALFTLYDKMQPALEARMFAQKAKAQRELAVNLVILCIILLFVGYFFTGIYLGITASLKAMAKTAHDICDGDLNARMPLKTKDELRFIGVAVNDISEDISRSMTHVKESSMTIAESAEQLAQQSSQTAQQMTLQSTELDQISTAITEMSASVNEVAANAERGSNSAQSADEQAVKGQEVVRQTVEAIRTLAENVSDAVIGVERLEEDSNNITGILDVIRGIAEQTNLLALNAAIEAARAGEQGRGFAVVADEVRTLAQRTQQSTLEIQEMIERIQGGIGKVAKSMSDSKSFAETAVNHADDAHAALADISDSVSDIAQMSLQIATAAEQQSVVSDEITKSVVKVSGVATRTTESAQLLVDTGNSLNAMSSEMALLVSRYNIDADSFNSQMKGQNLIHWHDKFNIGIAEADRQHQKMTELMNNAHIMSEKGRSAAAIAHALQSLIDYTEVHFDWEIKYIRSHGYPDTEQHEAEHNRLIAELRDHQTKLKNSNKQAIDQEILHLNDWLLKHIEHSDQDYARFINNK